MTDMNGKQKLEYYRFLRDDSRTRLQINAAILAFLEELRFWNNLAMTVKYYDSKEAHSLFLWVGDVLKTNFTDHYVE